MHEELARLKSILINLNFNPDTMWYLDVIYKLNIEFISNPDFTAGVCVRDFKPCLTISKEFADSLDDKEYAGLIVHEILHLAFNHNIRCVNRNAELWNISCDLEVNSIIYTYSNIKLPKGGLLPCQYDLPFKLNAEAYYKMLSNQNDNNIKKFNSKSHDGWSKDNDEVAVQSAMINPVIKDAVIKNKNNMSKELLKVLRSKLNLDNELESNSSIETTGASLSVKTFGKGKMKWNSILHNLLMKTLSNTYKPSFKRTSRRYGELVKGHIKNINISNKIVIAVDTSGSIDVELYKKFTREIELIRKLFNIEFRYIQCDCRIQQDLILKKSIKLNDIKLKGFGGTDFEPVFNLIEKEKYNPDLLIYFTDGDGYYPEKTNIKTLWVLPKVEEMKIPFGYKVYLNN